METTTCLLLDDLARNCVEEHHLERQFAQALITMTRAEHDELADYLYEAMALLHPIEQISHMRVQEYISDRVRRCHIDRLETDFEGLLRKLWELLRR